MGVVFGLFVDITSKSKYDLRRSLWVTVTSELAKFIPTRGTAKMAYQINIFVWTIDSLWNGYGFRINMDYGMDMDLI